MSEGFRLSPQQKRLWLIEQGEGDAYRARCLMRVTGRLDRAALRSAIESIVANHEIFRTTFQFLPGVRLPVQVIAEQGALAWDEHDLSGLAANEQAQRVDALWQAAESSPLDLEHGPVLHATLLSLSAEEHRLLIVLPAACADETTLELLAVALGESYTAALTNGDYEPEIMQYADVAEWQNGLLESSETEEGRKFWRDYWQRHALAGAYAVTLPIEQPSGAASSLQRLPIVIDRALHQQLEQLAQAQNVSAETVLLAAWQALLARLTDYDRLAVAIANDGRSFEELAEALGLFAKYLPVVVAIDEGSRFADLLGQTAAATQELQEWQEYFSWHEQELATGKPGTLPVLPFSFAYRRAAPLVAAGDVQLAIERLGAQIDRFKLRLSCGEHDGQLDLALDYDAAFFTPEAAQCLVEQLQTLLSGVVAHPEQTIGQLKLLGPAQRRRVIADFNRTSLDAVTGSSFQQLFAAQAARTPDAIAVVIDGRQLSYAELNSRANQLARLLQAQGVRDNALVGIHMRPSLELIVALLGTLKAGGAYVPLDPSYPAERIQFMLDDTRVALVLTQPSLVAALPPVDALALDDSWSALAGQPADDLPDQDEPAALAYVIYTSGSTGQPKGVAIEQRAVVNFKAAMDAAVYRRYADTPLRVALNAPISFDASVQQLISLLSGHTLHLLPDELRRDTPSLIDYFRRERIELFNSTPTQMQALLDAGLLDTGGHVPTVGLVAGEAISPALWQSLARAERTIFYNHYGPTEATVNTTVCRITPQPRPSIGHPLGNYQAYVLDAQLEPAAIGLVGELYLGGASLARGYLNRPALTAERFIPDPFGQIPGSRLYKTGDLARFQPDGTIEFIGRADTQVKLRGFRIELGEIETVLRQHPGVREAVAIVREDVLDYRRLVAYVVEEQKNKEQRNKEQEETEIPPRLPQRERGLGGEGLRAFLADRLPEYMIPSAFVFLQALPLTPSGKLDRKALPAPDSDRHALSASYVAPRTPLEVTLAEIWSQALGVDQVGIDDSYIALGGDSIRSIQMQTLAREHQLQFSLQQLFQHRTIRNLAEAIASQQQETAQGSSQPFSLVSAADRERLPADAEDAYPLSMMQEGVVYHSEYSPDGSMYQNLFSFHIGVAFKAELMQRAVQQLAA
ncbi:MAG: amino acid adenylation domain-containing protein, partial [Chloroflexi bacterium]|nr:amino acid adenylation domain-containing protein [Chloroflexota bacterium]